MQASGWAISGSPIRTGQKGAHGPFHPAHVTLPRRNSASAWLMNAGFSRVEM